MRISILKHIIRNTTPNQYKISLVPVDRNNDGHILHRHKSKQTIKVEEKKCRIISVVATGCNKINNSCRLLRIMACIPLRRSLRFTLSHSLRFNPNQAECGKSSTHSLSIMDEQKDDIQKCIGYARSERECREERVRENQKQ